MSLSAPKEPRQRGLFITFEGGEGSGKSTQARGLAASLEALGRRVLLTREPGGTHGAEIMREMLLSGVLQPFGAEAETIALYAARQDHLELKIKPALQRGEVVICDRFSDSTRAYQGAADKVDMHLINALDEVVVHDCQPDITFLLDISVEKGLSRAKSRLTEGQSSDRFEKADLSFHTKLRDGFLSLAKQHKNRIQTINADRDEATIAADILQKVQARMTEER